MPKTEEDCAVLKDRQGRNVALKGVNIRARLHGLMAEVEVEQSYTNPHVTNIEVIYTFPLPIGAVLLGLEVEIAGKKLSGCVVERKKAERAYEEAITDGDSAVMLEEAGPGLYTASIGNLMANESAVIRYRYALMLSWQRTRIRFMLPTTIAPRYGDAAAAGLQPHQVPEAALDVEYPLTLIVNVEGILASAAIASPSHQISVERLDSGIAVRLAGKAVLDRDFILTLESEAAQSACVQTQDFEGYVAVASLRIPPVQNTETLQLALKVVIDCSGSMAGTSITQARKAALEILNLLSPQDRFNVTLFGSQPQHLFSSLVPASAKHVTAAWNRLEKLDADMGGTEMEQALDSVFKLSGFEGEANVLLITDGEIHEHVKLVNGATTSGHRVFTVGVGNAVAEVFLQSLAATTGGACELIAPQEGMADTILSQFHRLRQPKLANLQIVWPSTPEWSTALPDTVFAGDTVHVFAGFKQQLTGEVSLQASAGEATIKITAPALLCKERELPRIAAAKRMEDVEITLGELIELALKYQLLSKWTNYLIVAERKDMAGELPELHQVPQMLAAGWGGAGKVQSVLQQQPLAAELSYIERPVLRARGQQIDTDDRRPFSSDTPVTKSTYRVLGHPLEPLRTKVCLVTPAEFIARMISAAAQSSRGSEMPTTVSELEKWGIPDDDVAYLRMLVRDGNDEAKVVVAYIYALSESRIGNLFGRTLKRAILKGWKDAAPGNSVDNLLQKLTEDIDAHSWGFKAEFSF